jgi:hypothetical protein
MNERKITEPAIKRAVKKYLDSKGYMEVDSRELHEQGPDIVMRGRNNGRFITIEAKGQSQAKSEKETKILSAIGQTVTRFKKHPNYIYGLAFPYDWKSRVAKKISYDAMAALNMYIYLVKENGTVIEINRKNRARLLDAP